MAAASTTDNDMESLGNHVSSKRRKKKSLVWEHFTIEAVGSGRRANCKSCKKTFAYSTGSKVVGTSHLKRHIAQGSCSRIRGKNRERRLAVTPHITPAKNGKSPFNDQPKKRSRISNLMFDQDSSLQDMVKMIIVNEYPLHMVEHSTFVNFIHNLQPLFKMVNFSAVETESLAIYHKEKQNVHHLLESIPGRISITLDLYMSSQTLGYICLTAHFIDEDWHLNRRVLNFTAVSFPHNGNYHGNYHAGTIGKCLSNWNLESKLFSITIDHSCNDNISTYLRDHHTHNNTVGIDNHIFVVRCYAYILNLIAQNGLEAINEIVYKIRESVKYVKSSHEHEEHFAEVVNQLQICTMKTLCFDLHAQWDTTYHMLVAALEFKQVFSQLETCDSNYNDAPTADEWKKVEILCRYLKILYDGANIFTGNTYPTSNLYFHESLKILLELTRAARSDDQLVTSVVMQMHEMFNKYWSDCSLVLTMAVVMDPRFKMKLVEFSYSKIYGDNASQYVKTVDESVHDLYLEYVLQPLLLTPASETREGGTLLVSDDGLLDFDVYISELASSQQTKSELDQYLEEALLPRMQELDILNWWKLNEPKYPTLSRMARDILAIPMSTVSLEFMFNTGGRVLDDYRSSLKPETVEALICAKDWLQYQHQQPQELVQTSNAIAKWISD